MNPLLEKKIIEEVKNPVNILICTRRMGDEVFKLMRGTQTRIEVYNGWDYGTWELTVADQKLFEVKGGELAFESNPIKAQYSRILTACREREQAEKTKRMEASYEKQVRQMTATERAIFDYLSR